MVKKEKDKTALILAVQHLLQKKKVGTQEEIKTALFKEGFSLTQAQVSRLLHRVGAIKMKEGRQVVYRLPNELMSISPQDSLKQIILNITHNEVMVVILTAPGCAQFVARFLDKQDHLSVLGTVAGDDTIFIAPEKIKDIQHIYQNISQLLLG